MTSHHGYTPVNTKHTDPLPPRADVPEEVEAPPQVIKSFEIPDPVVPKFSNDSVDVDTLIKQQGRERKPLMSRIIAWMMAFFLVLLGSTAGVGMWLYEQKVSKRVVDTRPCGFETDQLTLTGQRHYSYKDNSLFSFHWHDRSKVDIQTVLDVPFTGLTVVGIDTETNYRVFTRGKGEGGVMLLPQMHHYVFYSDGKVVAVADTAFCK